jgi:cytochrome P450
LELTTVSSADLIAPRLPWEPADPYPFYEARRRDGDVVWDDTAQAWLVLGYAAAREVLGGSDWSSDPAANPAVRDTLDPLSLEFSRRSMLVADGAAHQRLRGSVRDVFTRSFVSGLETGVEAIVGAVVDDPAADVEFDFMSDIALPIPIGVIAEWLDLEPDNCDLLRELSPVIVRMLGALADSEETRAGTAASAALVAEFLPLAADRRTHPRDDLFSFIAGDPDLDLEDIVVTAILIAVAGHETPANLLGNSIVRLLTPERDGTRLADRIDASDPAVLTELIRLDGPVQSAIRTATADTRIGDVAIACGSTALVVVAAANRDPTVFADPGEFRQGRTERAPLTFGYGAHHCLGAALARLEFAAALPRILARRPRLVGPVTWREAPAIRGPLTVPVAFSACHHPPTR